MLIQTGSEGPAARTSQTFRTALSTDKDMMPLGCPNGCRPEIGDFSAYKLNASGKFSTGFNSPSRILNAPRGPPTTILNTAGSSPVAKSGAQLTAPAFNVVGASASNQLAEALGQNQGQPVQAFVVANDVTTAQSLDRNIVSEAGI